MSDLLDRFDQIKRPKILVLGDLMLDRYTWGDAERVSPEAPVIVLRADQEEIRPGGAASVAYLLRHLDAHVSLAGVIGNDADGHTLRALFKDEGIDEQFVLTDPTRGTTSKQRFVGRASDRHPHQMLRVDRECREPVSDQLAEELWNPIRTQLSQFDAILIADYLKGVCTENLLHHLIAAARVQDIPVLVDPGRVSDYSRYRGATLLKPNRSEAELISGQPISSTEQAAVVARQLCHTLGLSAAMITLDRDGLVVATTTAQSAVSSVPRTIYDITGAGDMVLATLGLCVASGFDFFQSGLIANISAGLEVERFGVAPISRAEIAAKLAPPTRSSTSKIVTTEAMARLAEDLRQKGHRIVFTNGCFDLLHLGHATCLQEAAAFGDVLIVAINSDASVRRLKGATRPVVPESQRAALIASLECVDYVLIFEEESPHALLRAIRPDVLVKGGSTQDIAGSEIVLAYGGEVHRTGMIEQLSTTQLLQTIHKHELT